MNEDAREFMEQVAQTSAGTQELIGRLFEVAEPGAVYSAPVELGNFSVINATEVVVTIGAGFGGGSGPLMEDSGAGSANPAGGSGGGGGGISHGRPVAAIILGPGGVEVKPIVDTTKIGIALLTTLAAMSVSLLEIARTLRRND